MAFSEVSVVVFVLLVVAFAATTHARPDAFEDSSAGLGQATRENFCSSCECKGIIGRTCTRTDTKVGSCPINCGPTSVCTCENPTTLPLVKLCSCSYRVETCRPRACANAQTTLLEMLTSAQEN